MSKSRRMFALYGLILSLLITVVVYPAVAGDISDEGEVTVVGKINVGDVIEVQRDSVPLREGPSTSYTKKHDLNKGEIWIVQGGPQSAEGLTWWYVSIPPPYTTLDYSSYGWVAESGKDGILNLKEKTNNNPPDKPINQEPSNGAIDVSLTPTLRASTFSDPDGDSHLRTWWEVRRASDNEVVWDSGWRDYDLTSTTVPSGKLQQNTQYKWRVRYMDSKGAWSPVSDFTQFTTVGEITARIDSYSPSSQITVKKGESFTIKVWFTNTGDSRAYFYAGASIWDSNWNLIYDDWSEKIYLDKGQQESASWTHAINTPGEYYLQFGVWDETKSKLLDKAPSPAQKLIKVVEIVEQELQIVESFKVIVTQEGIATGSIKVYNPNDKVHYILANSFKITGPADVIDLINKGLLKIYATNLGSELKVPAKGYATIYIKVEADANCPAGTYYPKYKITSDV